jgi:hypothetical protein
MRQMAIACMVIILFLAARATSQSLENPSAPGFNLEGSDAKAIAIADEVMAKLGGWENWDRTRYITWKFFGRRLHVWDKWTGNIRVERGDEIILMNLHTKKGRAWKGDEEITHPDSLEKSLKAGYGAWVNDSYWMFMPYKLKDSGVTLKYAGDDTMAGGRPAEVLELTFEEVGLTPQNKYRVYVDKETRLIGQWDFFTNASDEKPRMSTPWTNWQQYGNILLSDDRGRGKHTDIAVFNELPASVFESPALLDFQQMKN